MTTKQTLINRLREWAWIIGIAGGIAGATGFQYVTGGTRITTLEGRVSSFEARVATLEGQSDIMQALALDLCLRTTDPRIRAPLECFRREAGQRVP
jgi:hypothetical protein